jgi:signal transduction histidine kinase
MPQERSVSSRGARLLLVDDDPSAILVMGKILSQYPNQRFATSGEVALRLAREATPDLILLDADMPGMAGFDVCEALKSDPDLARVPVIFVTSHDTPALKVGALQRGAADFISKPLVAAQLKRRVQAQLGTEPMIEDLLRGGLAAGAAPRQPSGQTPRFLIVDDDDAAILILRHTLSDMGDFHFAKTGKDALQLARRVNPHLILLDVHMPGVDGFAVCATLKADPALEHVPIVFVTRFSDPRNETRALDLGAADFIAKPFTPAVLYARVRNLLDLIRRTDAKLQAVRAHWRRVGDARVADIVGGASNAIVAAESASRTKTMMMSYIAHEIGNPLNCLLGFAQLMAGDARHPLAPEQTKRLEHIVSSGQQLEGLMREVMDLGRFEVGKVTIDLQQVDAAVCVKDAAAAVSELARQAGVTLLPSPESPSLHLTADADRLHQCLLNLLTNAIKYNRSGGWARIEVSGDAKEVAIVVRDNGMGMDAVQRQHLFEPFNRLGRQQMAPGSGLGLVITRQLVEAMHGQLRVDSELGQGSCFTITLPGVLDAAASFEGHDVGRQAQSRPRPS